MFSRNESFNHKCYAQHLIRYYDNPHSYANFCAITNFVEEEVCALFCIRLGKLHCESIRCSFGGIRISSSPIRTGTKTYVDTMCNIEQILQLHPSIRLGMDGVVCPRVFYCPASSQPTNDLDALSTCLQT